MCVSHSVHVISRPTTCAKDHRLDPNYPQINPVEKFNHMIRKQPVGCSMKGCIYFSLRTSSIHSGTGSCLHTISLVPRFPRDSKLRRQQDGGAKWMVDEAIALRDRIDSYSKKKKRRKLSKELLLIKSYTRNCNRSRMNKVMSTEHHSKLKTKLRIKVGMGS